MFSFYEFEKILKEATEKKYADFDSVKINKKEKKWEEKDKKHALKPQPLGDKEGNDGGKSFIKKDDYENKCQCKCFPCMKLKKCSSCTCKNCNCKGCTCKNYNKFKKK